MLGYFLAHPSSGFITGPNAYPVSGTDDVMPRGAGPSAFSYRSSRLLGTMRTSRDTRVNDPNTGPAVVAAPRALARVLTATTVQAVFLEGEERASWQTELAAAVEAEEFHIPRAELAGLTLDGVATWLDRNLPRQPLSSATRDALISDILDQFHLLELATGTQYYRLRILTARPNRLCGFHVDTVPPGTPTWGVLRVYNGAGTDWVDPRKVESMAAFYHWLQQRDQVVRRLAGNPAERDARLRELDRNPAFLATGAGVEHVSAGITSVFRQLDASRHWDDHDPGLAWIHSSPSAGAPRLVVNVSASRFVPF